MGKIIKFPARPGKEPAPTDKHVVIPHEGRFVVARRMMGTLDSYVAVIDCRTEKFAQAHADALNNGWIHMLGV